MIAGVALSTKKEANFGKPAGRALYFPSWKLWIPEATGARSLIPSLYATHGSRTGGPMLATLQSSFLVQVFGFIAGETRRLKEEKILLEKK